MNRFDRFLKDRTETEMGNPYKTEKSSNRHKKTLAEFNIADEDEIERIFELV